MSELQNVEIDYSQLEVSEILANLKTLKGQSNILSHEDELNSIINAFNTSLDEDRNQALSRFLEDGGAKEGFEFRLDPDRKSCIDLIKEIKNLIKEAKVNKKDLLKKNASKKAKLIDELREINDSSDLGVKNLNRVKEIQEEWRASDPVSSAINNELWPNYKGLLDIFYANRKLVFNLKDLDRKKNLEEKLDLCEKAESLKNIDSINEGTIIINELHKQYKSIGPVPEEESEVVWGRFKAATDAFHERRDAFMVEFKQKLNENLIKKIELLEQYKVFIESLEGDVFWKEAIKEFEELEEQWKSAGKVPHDKLTEVNNVYWSFVRTFLKKKRAFYKELDGLRGEAQKVKDLVIKELEDIIESDDFLSLKNNVLELQKKWWDSGAVPKKVSKEYNDRFKALCDKYFEKVRSAYEERDKEFDENLKVKKELVSKFFSSFEEDAESAYDSLKIAWLNVGEVSRKKASEIEKTIEAAIDKVKGSGVVEDVKESIISNLEFLTFEGHPNAERLISDKIQDLRKKISTYEYDLGTLKTNKEFFSKSKNAEKILQEFDDKIADLEKLIKNAKEKIKVLRKR